MTTRLSRTLATLIPVFVATSIALTASDSLVTAVFSSVSKGYKRQYAADGSPKPEYYAIAKGDYKPGAARDESMDHVGFPTVAATVSTFLEKQNYLFARDQKSADLLLMISWGTTTPFGDTTYRDGLDHYLAASNAAQAAQAAVPVNATRTPDGIQTPEAAVATAARDELAQEYLQMKSLEQMRERANEQNAKLLGYFGEMQYHDNISRVAGGGSYYEDLKTDIESERYFVIVTALDFQGLMRKEKPKVLWITRMSIQKSRNRFDADLATMVAQAAQYFGRSSGRLVRQYHEGIVTLGDLQVIGYEEETPAPASTDAPAEPEKKSDEKQ